MKQFACLMVACALTTTVRAQFFGGYADGVTSLPTGYNTGPSLRLVYDDFTFDVAGDINQFEMIGLNFTGSPVAMYYEIRSGMSAGNGGTLLYSGTTVSAVLGGLPSGGSLGTAPSNPERYGWYDAGLTPGSHLHLAAGAYWVGLAPLEGFGSFDVTSTVGLGSIGHPVDNGNAFYYDSTDPSKFFISEGASDFGLRVFTDAPTSVPEPATAALAVLGGVALFRCRRR